MSDSPIDEIVRLLIENGVPPERIDRDYIALLNETITQPLQQRRHLTQQAKAGVLERWEETKQNPRPEGAPGGIGWPDEEIFPACDRINALPYVCTLQSCAGHRLAADHAYPGELWLWFSPRASRAVDDYAFKLYGYGDQIRKVTRIYQDYGREILSIQFAGLAEGPQALRNSVAIIWWFLEHGLKSEQWTDREREGRDGDDSAD